MPKSRHLKKLKITQITTVVILLVLAIVSFVIAQSIGRETQDIRSQAYVLPAPTTCSATNKALCSLLGQGCLKTAQGEICLIIKPNTSTSLSCKGYDDLLVKYCDPNKVNQIFKGKVTCSGGPTKQKGCRVYCEPSSWKVTEDYCDWITDDAVLQTASTVNKKPFTWTFCSTSYRNFYTNILNYVPAITPRNGIEIICFYSANTVSGQTDPTKIIMRGNPVSTDNKMVNTCKAGFVHELAHARQFQENNFYAIGYSGENPDFNKTIGCQNGTYTKENPLTDLRSNCAEAFAEAVRFYVYPSNDNYLAPAIIDPNSPTGYKDPLQYKNVRPLQYNFLKNYIFGKEYP